MSVIEKLRLYQNTHKEAERDRQRHEGQLLVAEQEGKEIIRLNHARKLTDAMKWIIDSGAYTILDDLKKHLRGERLVAFPDGLLTDFDPKDEQEAKVVLKWGRKRNFGTVKEFDPDIPIRSRKRVRWSVWKEIAVTSDVDSHDINISCGVKTDKPEEADARDESAEFFKLHISGDEWQSAEFLEDALAKELHKAGVKV